MSDPTTPTSPAGTQVQIVEVSPRDGLQNEATILPVATKLELIRRILGAGLLRIEVASFVDARRVPQMADAEAVCAGLPRRDDAVYSALVLNRKGCARALATGTLQEISVVAVASDTFGLRNQGRTREQSLEAALQILRDTRAAGLRAQVSLAVAFGCPYEGRVPLQLVVDAVSRLAEAEPVEIALADTAGLGEPRQVEDAFQAANEALGGAVLLRGHFHDTRNIGTANALAAVAAGARALDASIGGIGGCPFAPGTAGNIATGDLLDSLGSSAQPGIDRRVVNETAVWLRDILGKQGP